MLNLIEHGFFAFQSLLLHFEYLVGHEDHGNEDCEPRQQLYNSSLHAIIVVPRVNYHFEIVALEDWVVLETEAILLHKQLPERHSIVQIGEELDAGLGLCGVRVY